MPGRRKGILCFLMELCLLPLSDGMAPSVCLSHSLILNLPNFSSSSACHLAEQIIDHDRRAPSLLSSGTIPRLRRFLQPDTGTATCLRGELRLDPHIPSGNSVYPCGHPAESLGRDQRCAQRAAKGRLLPEAPYGL